MTPSARELIDARHLRVKFQDDDGRLFVEAQEQLQPVHGLTSEAVAQVTVLETVQ